LGGAWNGSIKGKILGGPKLVLQEGNGFPGAAVLPLQLLPRLGPRRASEELKCFEEGDLNLSPKERGEAPHCLFGTFAPEVRIFYQKGQSRTEKSHRQGSKKGR